MQYAIAHLDQDGNGDSDKNPYISVDFENNLESCLEAANMMERPGTEGQRPDPSAHDRNCAGCGHGLPLHR